MAGIECPKPNRTRASSTSGDDCALRRNCILVEPASLPRHAAASYKRTSTSVILLATALLTGCASGIDRAEEACLSYRATAATFASCLRANFEILAGGMQGDRDIASTYLAAAEYQAAAVATGRITDAEAMLELATLNSTVLVPEVRRRREAAFQSVLDALQNSGSRGESTGSESTDQNSQAYGRGGPNDRVRQSGNYGQRGANRRAIQPGYYGR
jgi:hypothetical protein